MASVDYVAQAIREAKAATTADEAQDFEKALPLYMKSIETFMLAVKHENSHTRRKMLRDKTTQLLARAEKIRAHLLRNGPSEELTERQGATRTDDSVGRSIDAVPDDSEPSAVSPEVADKSTSFSDMFRNIVDTTASSPIVGVAVQRAAKLGTSLKNVLDVSFNDSIANKMTADTVVFVRCRKEKKKKNEGEEEIVKSYTEVGKLTLDSLSMNSHYMLGFLLSSSRTSQPPLVVHARYKDSEHNGTIALDQFLGFDPSDFDICGQFVSENPFVVSEILREEAQRLVDEKIANSCWETSDRLYQFLLKTVKLKEVIQEKTDRKDAVKEVVPLATVALAIVAIVGAVVVGIPYAVWMHGTEKRWKLWVKIVMVGLGAVINALLVFWVVYLYGPRIVMALIEILQEVVKVVDK